MSFIYTRHSPACKELMVELRYVICYFINLRVHVCFGYYLWLNTMYPKTVAPRKPTTPKWRGGWLALCSSASLNNKFPALSHAMKAPSRIRRSVVVTCMRQPLQLIGIIGHGNHQTIFFELLINIKVMEKLGQRARTCASPECPRA